jgi:molecular chaperone DnaJ
MAMMTAALGGAVEVPTIDGGRAKVTIAPGTQSGVQFRLRSKGMSVLNSSQRGDMYIESRIETPVNLSRKQRELLREFESAGKGRSFSPESESFFSKVKEFWADLKD